MALIVTMLIVFAVLAVVCGVSLWIDRTAARGDGSSPSTT
jgi:hypothetical protein